MDPETLLLVAAQIREQTDSDEEYQAALKRAIGGKAETFSERYRVRGVELFAAGKHRGKEYTTRDLDDIVRNFNTLSRGKRPVLQVPGKIGHKESQYKLGEDGKPAEEIDESDKPAAGWVEKLYRDGKVLKADVADIAPEEARAIKSKRFPNRSAEIYDEDQAHEVGIKGHKGKVLRAFAWLGADQPQVKGLAPAPPLERYGESGWRIRAIVPKGGAFTVFSERAPSMFPRTAQAFGESNFGKLAGSIERREGYGKKRADAIAAAVGRKKLGQAEMTRRAQAGKHGEGDMDHEQDRGELEKELLDKGLSEEMLKKLDDNELAELCRVMDESADEAGEEEDGEERPMDREEEPQPEMQGEEEGDGDHDADDMEEEDGDHDDMEEDEEDDHESYDEEEGHKAVDKFMSHCMAELRRMAEEDAEEERKHEFAERRRGIVKTFKEFVKRFGEGMEDEEDREDKRADKMSEKRSLSAREKRLAAREKRVERLLAKAEHFSETQAVTEWCESRAQQGKLTPAEYTPKSQGGPKGPYFDLLMGADDTQQVHKFSEVVKGKRVVKKTTAAGLLRRAVDERPAKFSEKFISSKDVAHSGDPKKDREQWAKETFSAFSESFKITGTTEKDFVESIVNGDEEHYAEQRRNWDARRAA